MLPTEHSSFLPLDSAGRYNLLADTQLAREHLPFSKRVLAFITADGEPGWIASYRHLFFSSWFNVFLIFVPLSAIAHHQHRDVASRFSFSLLAIMPLAKILGDCTEQISASLGQMAACILTACFGNAVEIIVGVAALLRDKYRFVPTFMLGTILSNILLVLGFSFLAAGFRRKESRFPIIPAQFMTLACATLVIPAIYMSPLSLNEDRLENMERVAMDKRPQISRVTALLLLFVYPVYLYSQLQSHSDLYEPQRRMWPCECKCCQRKRVYGAPANETDMLAQPEHKEEPEMSGISATVGLLAATVVTCFCADYLVASLKEFAVYYRATESFISIILLPNVANAARHLTSVWMAMTLRMELTIAICVGGSIRIATFVVSLMVIGGWILGPQVSPFFVKSEIIILSVSVLLVNTLIQDGKSRPMGGFILLALYGMISLFFWVL